MQQYEPTLNYLVPGEKPNSRTILTRMSEWGKCLLTGAEADLTVIPVDGDLENLLASNMACVSKELARTMEFTYVYSHNFLGYKIKFESPEAFESYNVSVLAIDESNPEVSSSLLFEGPKSLFKLYYHLLTRHIKGILEIEKDNISIHRFGIQAQIMRKLAEVDKPRIQLVQPL